jgi:transposase-like protein
MLSGEVECDEVYIVAGHKGNPDAVAAKGRLGRRRRLKGQRGRGTLVAEKPPVFGMLQRGGQVVIEMLDNVQQKTIKPIIEQTIQKETLIYTDEYNIYARLQQWGYAHKTVNHATGEYARDEDGDGFHEVHVNTMEGFWSLLRSWLRPHRGISQEKLPIYLGFFEFVHNTRCRGKALLPSLLALFLAAP